MSDAVPSNIRSASTVMLLRDEPKFQILMVRRNQQIDFMAGAMVFPGGKVDEADRDAEWAGLVLGWNGVPDHERGPRIAAIRETFEETGILLGAPTGGAAAVDDPQTVEARKAVDSGSLAFRDCVRQRGATPDLRELVLFSRWLTPSFMKKRFDTFFYLALAPAGQIASSDGRETVEAEWIAPAEAIRLAQAGERTIVFPTRMNLSLLSQTASVSGAVEAASRRPPATTEPRLELRESVRYLVLDPALGYGDVAERLVMP